MSVRRVTAAAVVLLIAAPVWPAGSEGKQGESSRTEGKKPDAPVETGAQGSPERELLASLTEPGLRELVDEVLERNPGLAVLEARARAALERAPQARALPDPVASTTAFLETPETRTGPQRLSLSVAQGLPWMGKRALKEEVAVWSARALESEVQARRLSLITQVRRHYHELSFLARHREITQSLRSHLVQHEEIARARYSTGAGSGQGVVKLQAAITRAESELLDIATRRAALAAQVNALRDAGSSTPVPEVVALGTAEVVVDADRLLETALRLRPEIRAARARISGSEALVALAEKGYRPDFTVGLAYTVVGSRDDLPGRLQPPPDNGDDILGLQAGITLPVRRQKLAAAVAEAAEPAAAARQAEREVIASIRGELGDLAHRVPLAWQRLHLIEALLIIQAEEAVVSAEAGYVSGMLNALDLLDAEHVLFEARTARARAVADYLIGLASLEGAIGGPLGFAAPLAETNATTLE